MSDAPRDLGDYAEEYGRSPFEPIQVGFRRRRVLSRVAARAPRRLLEIGCGEAPLFIDLPDLACTVIEPTPAFAEHARRLGEGRPQVTVVQAPAEEVRPDDVGGPFDMVVLSGLLHEVPDPRLLLGSARTLCAPDGVLHVNVPSAHSLHRLLAVAMGLIPHSGAESANQRRLQQHRVYDAEGLERELSAAGFAVRERGSILVKPFTHAQMQRLVDDGFLTPELLDGLDRLTEQLPELGSEIWMDAEPRD